MTKKKRFPYKSKKLMDYHGRKGYPMVHKTKSGRTYVMVRKKGGGTKRLYKFKKYLK